MKARFVNEVFDVLTWSNGHLTPEIYDNVKDSHAGKYGEKVQKGLFKCQNKDELLKWHNRTFEIGLMEMEDFTRGGDPYKKLSVGQYRNDPIDKLGNLLTVGDSVDVDATNDHFDFTGIVTEIGKEHIIVEDMDGDFFYVDSKEIELNESENFTRGMDPYKKLGIGSHQPRKHRKNI